MPKTRSPNFPAIDLERAIELARGLYDQAQRRPMPASALVQEVWSMSPTSSLGGQCIGALKAFGLVEIDGRGDHRMVRITDDAAKILENSPERPKLLRAAALLPRVHMSVWESCGGSAGLAPDATIQNYLLFKHDPPFNRSSIATFISRLRSTLEFAEIGGGDIVGHEGDGEGTNDGETITRGVYVQWTSQGVDQLPNPARVTRLTDDGYAFVEGSASGLPVSQLRVVDEPEGHDSPPPPRQIRRESGMNQDIFTLPEGDVVMNWPAQMSQRSFDRAKAWLALMSMKLEDAIAQDQGEDDRKSE